MSHQPPPNHKGFINGIVFGFDLGTASIGYAVRKEDQFLDVGEGNPEPLVREARTGGHGAKVDESTWEREGFIAQ